MHAYIKLNVLTRLNYNENCIKSAVQKHFRVKYNDAIIKCTKIKQIYLEPIMVVN